MNWEMSIRHVQLVGVFVNTPEEVTRSIMSRCRLDLAQFSGDESAGEVAQFGEQAFKAIRCNDRLTLSQIGKQFPHRQSPPAFLVDAASPGKYGGSGLKADWSQAEALARQVAILLAGGLTPTNVAEAIREVQPWGVDVASGIESSPGIKDHSKMMDFVQAVSCAEFSKFMEA